MHGGFNSRKEARLLALWLSAVLLIATSFPATALLPLLTQSVTLAWNPSPSTNVVGYDIYYGVLSGVYLDEISVGNVTNVTVPGLLQGTTYYFAGKAVNSAGIQSALSSQLSLNINVPVAAILGSLQLSGNGLSFSVTGVTGDNYIVQVSTNLVNWTPLATNAAPFQFTDTNAKYFSSRFYRVVYP
jgi:hypothetical protein